MSKLQPAIVVLPFRVEIIDFGGSFEDLIKSKINGFEKILALLRRASGETTVDTRFTSLREGNIYFNIWNNCEDEYSYCLMVGSERLCSAQFKTFALLEQHCQLYVRGLICLLQSLKLLF